jgi:methyl-accepting chemotaxis protein
MAVTVMAALVHFALARESGWDVPIAFGMLFLASWAAIEAAFKLPLGSFRTIASSGLAPLNLRDGGEIERSAGAVETAAHPAPMEQAEKISRELRAYFPLFERVRSEADAVSATTEEAAISLLGGLRNVDETISALLTFLESCGSNEKVVALIQHIEEHLNRNRQLLTEFLEHRNRDIEDSKQRLEGLEKIASSLVATALGVQGIARRITVLSLNASLEAARAGKAGYGFAVVAAEVKTLSHQSDKAAADIRSGLARLSEAMRVNMTAMIEKSVESQRTDMTELAAAVTDLSENLERLVAYQRDVLTKVHAESAKIADPIIAMMGSIQFQDVTRQRLQGLGDAFALAKTHLAQIEQAVTNLSSGAELPEFIDVTAEARNCWQKTEIGDLQTIELF